MKLRPVQLVCLALLLATLRLADPAALAPGEFALRAGYLQVLLSPEVAERRAVKTKRVERVRVIPAPAGVVAARVAEVTPGAGRVAWAMLPPALQSVAVQQVTGFGRRVG